MIIFLIGFMGSGKSTIGRPLASRLNCKFIDLDLLIQESEGRTIQEIFAEVDGEAHFRELEAHYLRQCTGDNIVVSTGGGTPCFNGNMDYMNRAGRTVYLKHEPETLTSRLINAKTPRPLIRGKSESELLQYVQTTLACREKTYNKATIIIANPTRDIGRIVSILQYKP